MTFVHLPFSVRSLGLFCRFTRAYVGHFILCYKEGILSRVEPLDRSMANFYTEVIGLHDFRYYLHVALSNLKPLICHELIHCFGSLLLQAMFLSLQVFAFKGQNTKFTVNMLLTCTRYCDVGPSCD